MKTLVIHPIDSTTDFLSKIYDGKDWTIIRRDISKSKIRKAITNHDRIIMLGHGTDMGLLSIVRSHGNVIDYKLVIDSKMVQSLKDKNIVAIWCNADEFMIKYGLKGFYTGMIISDFNEANLYSVNGSDSDINESNTLLADSIAQAIDQDDMLDVAKSLYTKNGNDIVSFNVDNLYLKKNEKTT